MPYAGMQFTLPFFITKSLDHLTGGAGITWTVSDTMLSKGSTFAAATNTPTALQSGWYALTVTSAEALCDFLGVSIVPSGTVYDPQNLLLQLTSPTTFYSWPQSLYQNAPFRTLAGAVGVLTNKSAISSGAYQVIWYKADDTTEWGQMTITQSAGFNPITGLDTV